MEPGPGEAADGGRRRDESRGKAMWFAHAGRWILAQ